MRSLLVAPSPKSQDQEAGDPPVEVSVNWTAWPIFGEEGDHVKFAAGGSGSVDSVLVWKVEPAALVATSVTVNEASVA